MKKTVAPAETKGNNTLLVSEMESAKLSNQGSEIQLTERGLEGGGQVTPSGEMPMLGHRAPSPSMMRLRFRKMKQKYADEIEAFSVRTSGGITNGVVHDRQVRDKICIFLFKITLGVFIAINIIVSGLVTTFEDIWEFFLDYAPGTVRADALDFTVEATALNGAIAMGAFIIIVFFAREFLYTWLSLIALACVAGSGQALGLAI